MNISEQLYHIGDTLNYMNDKVDSELRMIKALLKKLLDKIKDKDEICKFCFSPK